MSTTDLAYDRHGLLCNTPPCDAAAKKHNAAEEDDVGLLKPEGLPAQRNGGRDGGSPGEPDEDAKEPQPRVHVGAEQLVHELQRDTAEGEEPVSDSTVRFPVYDIDSGDKDDDTDTTTVPFQGAYAVSIPEAQGLAYDAIKVAITSANEDDTTHTIFYTAVTRARGSIGCPRRSRQSSEGSGPRKPRRTLLSSRRGLTSIPRRRP